MRALVSGQAGVAVLCDPAPMFAVAFDAPGERVRCGSWAEARALFAGAGDVYETADITPEETAAELDRAWARDRALQLTLVLLDGSASAEVRADAAESAGELLSEPAWGVESFVADRLHAAPLPAADADPTGAAAIADRADPTGRVVGLLRALDAHQPRIVVLRASWDDLPLGLFSNTAGSEGAAAKARAESVLVAAGAFRRLAAATGAGTLAAVAECMSTAAERGVPRTAVTAWVRPLLAPTAIPSMIETDEEEVGRKRSRRDRQSGKDRPYHKIKEGGARQKNSAPAPSARSTESSPRGTRERTTRPSFT